jgi:hypothetical protein
MKILLALCILAFTVCVPKQGYSQTTLGSSLKMKIIDHLHELSTDNPDLEVATFQKQRSLSATTFFDRIDSAMDTLSKSLEKDTIFLSYFYDAHEYDEFVSLVFQENGKYEYYKYSYIDSSLEYMGSGNPSMLYQYFVNMSEMEEDIDSSIYLSAYIVENSIQNLSIAKGFSRFLHLETLLIHMNTVYQLLQNE